jgi:subtilisin family serine protease
VPPPPPATDRNPRQFEPWILSRSVIAIPLLKQIQSELETTARVKAEHPGILEHHNAAIIFRHDARVDVKALRKLLASISKELHPKRKQTIDNPDPTISERVCLAWLDGPVIRELLGHDAADQHLIERIWPERIAVIIDINLEFKLSARGAKKAGLKGDDANEPDPRVSAKALIKKYIEQAMSELGIDEPDEGVDDLKTNPSSQYVFARLRGETIQRLVEIDQRMAEKIAAEEKTAAKKRRQKAAADEVPPDPSRYRAIYHIWPDFKLDSFITRSIATVKVDAARHSFTAMGKGIVWAVMDSGIDAKHPHFAAHRNIDPTSPHHADFSGAPAPGRPLVDEYGHGTHVAGIIAGEQSTALGSDKTEMVALWRELDTNGIPVVRKEDVTAISGMAPKCQLVSLKVLDKFGQGTASNVMAAITHVQLANGHGRDIKIHGVNLSVGHAFDPKWFACGHSPLCVEVNRLVKSGVVVVIAAGNTGYGTLQVADGTTSDATLDLTINDPGNAEHAITVGSTHREMPHRYGVSYFSSKGPTGDGRCKPDLLAPGEKIISCAARVRNGAQSKNSVLVQKEAANDEEGRYFETSGTSMAAPHVSGAIAAFLSIRTEFKGEPELVKKIFTSTATDLGRDRYFQGSGLVDLMRAIQSV